MNRAALALGAWAFALAPRPGLAATAPSCSTTAATTPGIATETGTESGTESGTATATAAVAATVAATATATAAVAATVAATATVTATATATATAGPIAIAPPPPTGLLTPPPVATRTAATTTAATAWPEPAAPQPEVPARRSATRPLLTQAAVGLATTIAASIPLAYTFGSDRVVVAIPILVGGVGAMGAAGLGALWALSGLGDRAGTPTAARAAWQLELGTLRVDEPLRGARTLAHLSGAVALGNTWISPSIGWNVEGGEQRARVEAALPLPATLSLRPAAQLHRGLAPGVSTGTFELAVHGRLEGARLAPSLRGSFAEASFGGALEVARYDAATDASDLLLARIAWGVAGRAGEVSGFYDHRRDHLAGGLVAGRAAGFFGSFGLTGLARLVPGWAVTGHLELGSAWVLGVGLRAEGGLR